MRVVILGHPVGHSLSPRMQQAAFTATGLDHVYEAVDVDEAGLPEAVAALRVGGYLGANVTVPHKLAAAHLVDELDDDAGALGAVNTIVVHGDRLSGHNTDALGASRGLLHGLPRAAMAGVVTLLGAGGGARAVMLALTRSDQRPEAVMVVARREAQAGELARLGMASGLSATALDWSEVEPAVSEASVVINCTPLGLDAGADPIAGLALNGKHVLDLAYRPGGTPLIRRARETAITAVQGDAMLLHQGAAAFKLWTGMDAPIDVMREALNAAIAA